MVWRVSGDLETLVTLHISGCKGLGKFKFCVSQNFGIFCIVFFNICHLLKK